MYIRTFHLLHVFHRARLKTIGNSSMDINYNGQSGVDESQYK